MGANTIRVNGVSIDGGQSISVTDGKIVVDGRAVDLGASKSIIINISGDVADLNVDRCDAISITGAVGRIKSAHGDVRCGDVAGNVKTRSGDVFCGKVAGNVTTDDGDIFDGK